MAVMVNRDRRRNVICLVALKVNVVSCINGVLNRVRVVCRSVPDRAKVCNVDNAAVAAASVVVYSFNNP